MKAKTVGKIIHAKFDQWLASIENDALRDMVAKNTIITGGSIASLLLNEQVNDYDIYFRNKETVLAVANYYVHMFKQNVSAEFKEGDRKIEIEVRDEEDRVKIYIKSAGIASETSGDDYQYFESRPDEEGENYIEKVVEAAEHSDEVSVKEENKKKYRPVFLSANAITLSDKMQIVLRFYGEPDAIHQHYDYIHCTNYWTSDDGKLTLHQAALEALLARELVYVGSKYPLCSIIRTRKFLKRGWTINAGQYLKMCFQVSELDLKDIKVLEDQLIGVDAAYFGQLIDGLTKHAEKQEGGFKLDYGYLATIIDKIF